MVKKLLDRLSRVNQAYGRTMSRMAEVETFGALLFMLTIISGAWALAWYGHIIGPWMDRVLGLGPHDIDTAGKIRWRHIWSTAICVPSIVVFVGLYILNVRDRIRYRKRFGKDQPIQREFRRLTPQLTNTVGSDISGERPSPSPPERQQTVPLSLEQDWTKTVATTTVVMHTPSSSLGNDGGKIQTENEEGHLTLIVKSSGKRSEDQS